MNEELQSANEELNTSKEELQTSNETLARSNSDLENLFRSSNTATLFLDKSGCIRNFTPAMLAIYGLRESDVGRPLAELTSKAITMPELPTMHRLVDDPKAGNETIETTDGRWFVRRVFPYKTISGDADGVIVTFTEVTDIRIGQQRLEMALKGGDLGAWDLDLVANQSWRSARHDSIFGDEEPLDDWGMDTFLQHIHEDDRGWIQTFLESTNDREHWDCACRIRQPNGEVRWIETHATTVFNETGKAVRMFGTVADITDRVKFQEELQRMRQLADAANQAKSDFLANMSHEIRSPMTAILGFAELLNVEGEDDKQKVETIQRNGQFLLELINDILDLSKIEAGKVDLDPVTFSPAKLLEDVSSLMSVRAVDSGLDLSVEYEGELPTSMRSDPIRLRQVLINLTGNAIKFTDSGTVELRMSYDDQRSELRYTVSDTGIGMTPEQQRKLFRPFSQTDSSILREYGGSGLGLAISQRLAELLGGYIEVASELGRGSSFTLAVPCEMNTGDPVDDEPMEPRSAPLNSGQLKIRVLVVDDRRDIRFLSQHFVKQLGGEVITAENGLEAIEAIETEQAAGRKIDAVLMDVQMPKMDGFTAVRKLRVDGFTPPIIALTANAMDSDRDACFEACYTDYLSKPIDAKKLTEALRRHCGPNA